MINLPPRTGSTRTPMPCYQVGPSNPKRIIVVFSDVYGIDSGSHKVICDVLQEAMNDDSTTAVWMPDMMRGKPILGAWKLGDCITTSFTLPSVMWACHTNMKDTKVEMDLEQVVAPALSVEAAKVACVGFCYGAWVAGICMTKDVFPGSVGIGVHPSWKVEQVYSRQEVDLAAKVGAAPYLFLPAGNDDIKVGHAVVDIMAKARGVEPEKLAIEFPDMMHGFVPRGDSTDTAVKEAQDKVISLIVEFVKEHAKV